MRWYGFQRGIFRLPKPPWTGRTWRKRLSESKGKVTDLIKTREGKVFGLKFGGNDYLFSFEDRRGTPFDDEMVQVGSLVRIEWAPFTKDGKEKKYVNVLELLAPDAPSDPSAPIGTGYRTPDQMQRAKALTEAVLLVSGVAVKVGSAEDAVGQAVYAFHQFLPLLLGEDSPGPTEDEVPFE